MATLIVAGQKWLTTKTVYHVGGHERSNQYITIIFVAGNVHMLMKDRIPVEPWARSLAVNDDLPAIYPLHDRHGLVCER